ncbi:MAG: hypothetical protein QG574_4769 [Cyanobacteriota bacterium erpe_2018_sw_21hr_WHONDRS-SW48-000092_B_bin.40]|jgi:hypothetical protein|nr:hypothetical protein [Cyanobacteriota bacterium erpe_2018_sw_21hr_WHONDRS-SW48-000092_B_bin.40]
MHTAESKISSKRRLNILDYGLVVVTLLSAAGFGLAKAGHAGVNQVIKGTHKVNIEVFITGLKTKDINLFKVGDKSSITIRNQPVQPPMTIVKVDHQPKQVAFLSPDGKKAMAFPDPANSIAHDFYVTVQDEADATDDGYVIRGNKIKLGNQIELEAFKYRVQGVVVDINQAL